MQSLCKLCRIWPGIDHTDASFRVICSMGSELLLFITRKQSHFIMIFIYSYPFFRLEVFEQVFEAPRMYILAVLEILRRKSFSVQFLEVGDSNLPIASILHETSFSSLFL